MSETYRDIILKAVLKVEGAQVKPPDMSAAERVLKQYEDRLKAVGTALADQISKSSQAAHAASTANINRANAELQQHASRLKQVREDYTHLNAAQDAARREFGDTSRRMHDQVAAARELGQELKRLTEIQELRARVRGGPQPGDPVGPDSPAPDNSLDDKSTKVDKLSTHLRKLQAAYIAVQTAIPAFILMTDRSASATARAAAGTFGLLSASKGLTSVLGPLGLVTLPLVVGAVGVYVRRQGDAADAAERLRNVEQQRTVGLEKLNSELEHQLAMLEKIAEIRERERQQRQERRERGFNEAAEIAGMHRDPMKRREQIIAEERNLQTKAGGLQARLVAQEMERQKLRGLRPSDETVAAEREASEMAKQQRLSHLRRKQKDLQRIVSDSSLFGVNMGGRNAVAAAAHLAGVTQEIDDIIKGNIDFSEGNVAGRRQREIDERIKKSMGTSQRTQGELSALEQARGRLGGDRLRAEFEIGQERLQALRSVEQNLLAEQREREQFGKLSPLERLRRQQRGDAPGMDAEQLHQREVAFAAAERFGGKRESFDTLSEVRSLIKSALADQDRIGDAEVEQARTRTEATNKAKDAATDFGNATEELAAKLVEVSDKALPVLDQAIRALNIMEDKVGEIGQALQQGR